MAYINVGFTYIIDYICEGILTGRFPEGERIPSVRDMAVLMQVAPQRGVGYYITPGAFESVLAQRRKVFHEETIPQFKRDARLLGITPDELRELLEL